MRRKSIGALLAVTTICAVAFSPASFGQSDLNDAARIAYQKQKEAASRRGDLISTGLDFDRIQRVTKKLIAVAPEMQVDAGSWAWDVAYIRSSQVNAFCLPGGKMMVYSGLVERLSLTDDELAAVMGHEMGHALLEHGKESYTERQTARVAVGILSIIAAVVGAKNRVDPSVAFNAGNAVGSLGAEFLALRPYNRERELAADRYGAELAARAGFDPGGAIELQKKMASHGTSIEFLSTHPSSETRIQELVQAVPATAERFASRRSSGQNIAVATASGAAIPLPVLVADNAESPAELLLTQGVQGMTRDRPQANSPPPQSAALAPQSSDDPQAVTGAAAAAMTSKYMINAEQYAKSGGCSYPVATMIARAPTYEVFAMRCSAGTQMLVRCDNGSCLVPG